MNPSHQNSTARNFLRNLSVLHFGLFAGPTLFGILTYFLHLGHWKWDFEFKDDIFIYVIPLVSILGIVLSNNLFKKHLSQLSQKSTLKEKLIGYQTFSIIQYAQLEGPALLSVVAAFVTNNLFYITIALILILYLVFLRPSKDKIITDLNLNAKHKSHFEMEDKFLE